MIRLNLEHLVLLGVLSAAIHWLVARSLIFSWFWSRVTGWAQDLLSCPACSGFWIGLGLGVLGVRPLHGLGLVDILGAGLFGIYLTPIIEGTLLWGLKRSSMQRAEDSSGP